MSIMDFNNCIMQLRIQSPVTVKNNKQDDSKTDEKNEVVTNMQSQQENSTTTTEQSPYEQSIELISGTKTDFSLEVNGKIYYYKSRMDLALAKLSDDPSKNAVGVGNIKSEWGEKTEFCINTGNEKLYFASRRDLLKAKCLNKEEILKLAVGRFPAENIGGSDIKNNDEAVTDVSGSQTDYYIDDSNGNRYYYNNAMDMARASLSADGLSTGSCGKAEVYTQWGKNSDYFIDYNGKRYYFASEADKQTAEKQLQEDSSIWGMLKFNKLLIGKGNIPKED